MLYLIMRVRTAKLVLSVIYTIFLIFITLLLLFPYTLIHEGIHSLACFAVGLKPQQSYFSVDCKGIEGKSAAEKFFFSMSPYIFSLIMLSLGLVYYTKHKIIKYLCLIPVMDISFNYLSSLRQSDFSILAAHTFPNKIPFLIGMIIVIITLMLTVDFISKTRLFSFKTFERDWWIVKRPKKMPRTHI